MGSFINEQFSDNPMENVFGVVTGTSSWLQFPSGTCKILRFKANPGNIGIYEIARWNSDYQGYFPMSAGDDTGWIAPPTADGNERGLHDYAYRNLSGTTEYLHYWLQK